MKIAAIFFGFDSNIAILNNIINSEYFVKMHERVEDPLRYGFTRVCAVHKDAINHTPKF